MRQYPNYSHFANEVTERSRSLPEVTHEEEAGLGLEPRPDVHQILVSFLCTRFGSHQCSPQNTAFGERDTGFGLRAEAWRPSCAIPCFGDFGKQMTRNSFSSSVKWESQSTSQSVKLKEFVCEKCETSAWHRTDSINGGPPPRTAQPGKLTATEGTGCA